MRHEIDLGGGEAMSRRWLFLAGIFLTSGCSCNEPPAVDQAQEHAVSPLYVPRAVDLEVFEALLRNEAMGQKLPDGEKLVFYVGFGTSKGQYPLTDPSADFLKRFEGLDVQVKPYSAFQNMKQSVQNPDRVMELYEVKWKDQNAGTFHFASWNEQMWCGTAWPYEVHREGAKWVIKAVD
jgi:hypothetical protein